MTIEPESGRALVVGLSEIALRELGQEIQGEVETMTTEASSNSLRLDKAVQAFSERSVALEVVVPSDLRLLMEENFVEEMDVGFSEEAVFVGLLLVSGVSRLFEFDAVAASYLASHVI